MSDIEHAVELEASEAGAEAGAAVAAVVAEHAAESGASEAVEEAIEEVRDLAERVENAVDTQEDDAQWQRLRNEMLEMENRIVSTLPAAIALAISQSTNSQSESTTSPTEQAAEATAEAADELAEVADELTTEAQAEAATFDPLAVESVVPQESGRRRLVGRGRRG